MKRFVLSFVCTLLLGITCSAADYAYGILINSNRLVQAEYMGESDGYTQYLAHVQLNALDTIRLIETTTNATWMVDLDTYSVSGFSGSKELGYLLCTAAGCYDCYIKLFYQADQLYIGNGTEGCSEGIEYDPTPKADENRVYLTTGITPSESGAYVYPLSGEYEKGSTVQLKAEISVGGWMFDKWSDDNSWDNPRTVMLTQDTTITAIFSPGEYGVLVNGNRLFRGTFTERLDGSYIAQFLASVQMQEGDYFQLINLFHSDNATWRPQLEEGGSSGAFSIDEAHNAIACNTAGCYDIYMKIHYGQSNDYVYIGGGTDCPEGEPFGPGDVTANYYLLGENEELGAWNLENAMPMEGDSIELSLPAGFYKFKILPQNTSWNNQITFQDVDLSCSSENVTGDSLNNYNINIKLSEPGLLKVKMVNGKVCVTGNFSPTVLLAVLTMDGAEDQGLVTMEGKTGEYIWTTTYYTPGTTATIQAIPLGSYSFSHWSDGNTDNPRQLVVNTDTTLTAIFKQGEQQYYLVGSSAELGSWSLDNALLMDGDSIVLNLPSNAYEFLVLPQGTSWNNSLGYNDLYLECSSEGLEQSGTNNIKFILANDGEVRVRVVEGRLCVIGVFGGEIPITGYSVVGDEALFGTGWDVESTLTEMTQQDGGTWTYVLDSVQLLSETFYYYKIIANHSWSVAQYPEDNNNYSFTVEEEGAYSVVFRFTPEEGGSAIATKIIEGQGTPTVANLAEAGYDVDNKIVLCIEFIEDAVVCNPIHLVSNINQWGHGGSWDGSQLFTQLPGFDSWYVAQIEYGDTCQAKPIQESTDGSFSWYNQSGDIDSWQYVDGQQLSLFTDMAAEGECHVGYPTPGAYIYRLRYWKNHKNPCSTDTPEEYTFTLDANWQFITLPTAFGLTPDDIIVDGGEIEWGIYNSELRAAGRTGWQNFIPVEDGLYASQAYIVRARNGNATLTFHIPEAARERAEATLPVNYHAATHSQNANWNFLGNPYPFGYNITAALNAAGIESPVTVWNGTGYDMFTPGIDEKTLSPFEAFFIQLPEGGTEALPFSPEYITGD